MNINTSELIDSALNWAVAKCEDLQHVTVCNGDVFNLHNPYRPSSDWSQGGPIVEGHFIDVVYDGVNDHWEGSIPDEVNGWTVQYGERPLIAAMRAYVASKLGDVVAVPEELL